MRQSIKIIHQAIEKLRAPEGQGDILARGKITPPSRADMKTSMEALIHHFKLYTEGFHVPEGEVYARSRRPRASSASTLWPMARTNPTAPSCRAPGCWLHLQAMDRAPSSWRRFRTFSRGVRACLGAPAGADRGGEAIIGTMQWTFVVAVQRQQVLRDRRGGPGPDRAQHPRCLRADPIGRPAHASPPSPRPARQLRLHARQPGLGRGADHQVSRGPPGLRDHPAFVARAGAGGVADPAGDRACVRHAGAGAYPGAGGATFYFMFQLQPVGRSRISRFAARRRA
jgi:hypothetical protein